MVNGLALLSGAGARSGMEDRIRICTAEAPVPVRRSLEMTANKTTDKKKARGRRANRSFLNERGECTGWSAAVGEEKFMLMEVFSVLPTATESY